MLRSAILVLADGATAVLASCASEPPVQASAASIAATAAAALEQSIGELPELDCGDEMVELRKGTTLDCVLTDPQLGADFDSEVTISEVDGATYSVPVDVAEEPRD
ncbi:hypothetical protein [Salinibacterium sp. PAMC 21357]|uniref:hypothetical protein n=1 Tax=Salinibacterium sp. PAMC 21357 TaxID=1112215 RepID=UPI000289D599|nr:hypothetical protein [Salinibacterium sp. PAMC 21357]